LHHLNLTNIIYFEQEPRGELTFFMGLCNLGSTFDIYTCKCVFGLIGFYWKPSKVISTIVVDPIFIKKKKTSCIKILISRHHVGDLPSFLSFVVSWRFILILENFHIFLWWWCVSTGREALQFKMLLDLSIVSKIT